MNNLVKVNKQELSVKEYNGQRVVTLKEIDKVHGRPEGTAGRNFRENCKHFIEGTDFFIINLTSDEIRRQFGTGKHAGRTVTVLTESGYLMLAKSFTDDLAWKVQRELVNNYFRPQPECEQLTLSETSSAPYKYIDKLYKGQPVLSTVDIEAFTGINKSTIDWYLHTKRDFIIGVDYFFLKGQELADFKEENPRISKLSAALYLITKSGFEKLMKKCGKQCASPKCFIEQKPKKKEEYAVVIDNTRIQAMISHIKKELVAVDVLLDKYNRHNILVDDMEALKKTISDVGVELSCDISSLAHERYRTTFEMKK